MMVEHTNKPRSTERGWNSWRATLAALTLVLIGGCGSSGPAKRFDEIQYAYASTIRWNDYLQAVNFIHPDDRPTQRQIEFELSRLANVSIAGYRELQQLPGNQPEELELVVELRVVNNHTKAERTVIDRQRWRYDETLDRWWLVSGLPDLAR